MSNDKFSFCNLLLLYFLISTTHPNVFAYNTEGILGGTYAKEGDIKYHAPIMSRHASSNTPSLVGGGAFIHKNLVLSAAHIFLQVPGILKDLTFSIVIDTLSLNAEITLEMEFDLIFVLNYKRQLALNDIAVAKLKRELDFSSSQRLIKLDIPSRDASFERSLAVVSGFGSVDFKLGIRSENGEPYRFNETFDERLKYAYVTIATDKDCKESYPAVTPNKQICGVMNPVEAGQPSGLSTGDGGNPLVVGRLIVGVATIRRLDSYDIVGGCVYTRVSAYQDFIQAIKDGKITRETQVLENIPHRYFKRS